MTTRWCEEACRGYRVRPVNKSESFSSASDFLAREQHPEPACVFLDVWVPRAERNGSAKRRRSSEKTEARRLLDLLTPREFEVMQLVVTGMLNDGLLAS
jgi:FixJ family two-component response regulator